MQSVREKFEKVKEEGIKFVTETNQKAKSYMSTIKNKINTIEKNNYYKFNSKIDIENISNQLKQITSFLHQYYFFYRNYKSFENNFFTFFEKQINSLMLSEHPILTNKNLNTTKEFLNHLSEYITINEEILKDNSSEKRNSILQHINHSFKIFEDYLNVNFKSEKENLNNILYFLKRVENFILCGNRTFIQDDFEINLRAKNSKVKKIILIKENNNLKKFKSILKFTNKFYRNYDLYIYIHISEKSEIVRQCLMFIKNNIMRKYVMYIKYSKFNNYYCFNIFGIGKSNLHVFRFLKKFLTEKKINMQYSMMIKYSIYDELDVLMMKKFSKINSELNINKDKVNFHFTFDDNYIKQFCNI